ncbi:hypothetical protein B1759_16665 [Rubrivirga sp. SAORIC476]|uniref:hypothetical protein n=1 Tax=Rubrivirga sp. SAORIC476 TaxID=1961794 RepID=UPI000BA946D0|nr:hypothetical protein [Rubrivirga sp. SAORIC476]PAP74808.1 hypothetical protein B1759_16665 [Rubrivirga sp. SAORIC476]
MASHRIKIVCEAGTDPFDGTQLDRAEEVLEVDAPSLWEARTAATRQMALSPMGRLLKFYDSDTGKEIASRPPAPLREAVFALDGLPGTYQGFTRGESWNGFAVPYFLLPVAKRVASDIAAHTSKGQWAYEAAEDVIRTFDPIEGEWEEWRSTPGGEAPLYGVGARAWTWEEKLCAPGPSSD